jgi:Protein of unknown function (DUF2971)
MTMQTAVQNGVRRLYHYQGASPAYLRDILKNQRVYFSNPKNFNDPWDCSPYFHVIVKDPESRRKWGERLDPIYHNLPVDLRAKLEIGQLGNWYDNEELLRKSIDGLTQSQRQITTERWRVYCLTPHPDSVLMWAHYAEKHQGVCLEFESRTKQVGNAYRVVYQDTLPVIGPDDFDTIEKIFDAVLLTKSREWSYEDEYRILARDEDADASFSLRTSKDYLELLPGTLTGIIAGCKADVDAIKETMVQTGCNIPLKLAMRIPNRYQLDIVG